MIEGQGEVAIAEQVGQMFSTSARTIRSDLSLIRRRWAADDRRRADQHRHRILRAIRANGARCEAAGDTKGHLDALKAEAKLRGMEAPVLIDARRVEVTVNALPPEALRAASALLASLGSGEPGGPTLEPVAGLLRPDPAAHPNHLRTNGHGGNGRVLEAFALDGSTPPRQE